MFWGRIFVHSWKKFSLCYFSLISSSFFVLDLLTFLGLVLEVLGPSYCVLNLLRIFVFLSLDSVLTILRLFYLSTHIENNLKKNSMFMGVFQGGKKKYLFTRKILSILGGEDGWNNFEGWLVNLTSFCFCLIY